MTLAATSSTRGKEFLSPPVNGDLYRIADLLEPKERAVAKRVRESWRPRSHSPQATSSGSTETRPRRTACPGHTSSQALRTVSLASSSAGEPSNTMRP